MLSLSPSVHKIRVQELPRRTCTPKTRCRTYTAYSTSGRAGPAYIDSDVVSCRWEQKKVPKNNLPRSNVVSRVSASVFWGFWLGITLVADSKIGFWLFTKCIFFCSRSTRPYRESRAVHVRLFWGRRTGRTCTFWEHCLLVTMLFVRKKFRSKFVFLLNAFVSYVNAP